MSNREYISEREYRIKHVRLDDHGKVQEEYYRYYTENETETTIFLTKEWMETLVKSFYTEGTVSTSTSTYPGGKHAACGKDVVFEETFGGETVPVKECKFDSNGKSVVVTWTRLDDTTFEFVYPLV